MRLITLLLLALIVLPLHADEEPADFAGMLAVHNRARAAVRVVPLTWSAALSAEAQQWADQLTREQCALRYDPDPQRRETTGQNLFRAYGSTPYAGYKRSPANAAARWLRDSEQYDHGSHRCRDSLGSQCGPYLQMIWETTTAMGCGRARCEQAEVWVCHYAPRGGQEGLLPYGNPPPQSSPVVEATLGQQCGWQGPTPAPQFSDELRDPLAPQ